MRLSILAASLSLVAMPPVAGFAAEPCDARCKVQGFIERNVGIALDRPLTLDTLRKFAPVTRETTAKVVEFEGANLHRLEYAGLTVTVVERADKSVMLETIDLTGGAYRMAYGIKLGKIEGHDVDFYLGPPAETRHDGGKPAQWVYTNIEQTEVVTFDRTDTAILAVHWDFTPGD